MLGLCGKKTGNSVPASAAFSERQPLPVHVRREFQGRAGMPEQARRRGNTSGRRGPKPSGLPKPTVKAVRALGDALLRERGSLEAVSDGEIVEAFLNKPATRRMVRLWRKDRESFLAAVPDEVHRMARDLWFAMTEGRPPPVAAPPVPAPDRSFAVAPAAPLPPGRDFLTGHASRREARKEAQAVNARPAAFRPSAPKPRRKPKGAWANPQTPARRERASEKLERIEQEEKRRRITLVTPADWQHAAEPKAARLTALLLRERNCALRPYEIAAHLKSKIGWEARVPSRRVAEALVGSSMGRVEGSFGLIWFLGERPPRLRTRQRAHEPVDTAWGRHRRLARLVFADVEEIVRSARRALALETIEKKIGAERLADFAPDWLERKMDKVARDPGSNIRRTAGGFIWTPKLPR
ncbi:MULTISPECIES: hypothetical protein [Bradyrhizobium]|uniref:hypothetical protein n=1 Tax=Bradyrhizobium TaxID=374 RepID=UPI0012F51EF2|nr:MULTISPECIES: hypothetical protein [Bradyrhizobium]MBR1366860.1 hypothetical protein [Bradyrhizobium ottawaense]